MHISELSTSRSICVMGDWDNTVIKYHLNEWDSYDKAREALETLADQWESKTRAKRTLSPDEKLPSIQYKQNKQNKEANLLSDIMLAKSIKELETFIPFIEPSDAIAKASYDLMHKKLSNNG